MAFPLVSGISFFLLSAFICYFDIRQYRIPNVFVYPGFAVFAAIAVIGGREEMLRTALGVGMGFIIFGVTWLIYRKRFGLGDVKYGMLMGAFLGVVGWYVAVMLAVVFALIAFAATRICKRDEALKPLPFSPFLCAGSMISFVLYLLDKFPFSQDFAGIPI